MNKRLLTVLGFAIAISGGASAVLYRLIASRLASQQPTSGKIVVASRDLAVGTMVRSFDVKDVDWSGPAPARAIVKREEIEGRGVVANIYEGEPIREDRLAARGAGAGLAATIPEGMRAVAVRVNEVVGLAGFVTPGMHVDILIIGSAPNMPSQMGTLTRTLLQNIEVLSAGQQMQRDAEGKPVQVQVVNMLVTPEQAESLTLANTDARIQLVLRNPLDKKESNPPGTALARLFGGSMPPPPPPAAAPAPRRYTPPPAAPAPIKVTAQTTERISVPIVVEIIHGVKRAETKFKNEDEKKDAPEAK